MACERVGGGGGVLIEGVGVLVEGIGVRCTDVEL